MFLQPKKKNNSTFYGIPNINFQKKLANIVYDNCHMMFTKMESFFRVLGVQLHGLALFHLHSHVMSPADWKGNLSKNTSKYYS